MAYFPLFIDIKEKKCLVIGGGKVAKRKVDTLLMYDAHVHVVSPEICREIREALGGEVHEGCICREAVLSPPEMEEEIRESVLVVAATGSRETNHQVSEICHRLGIPVNVVDAPLECTFLFPAVVKKGEISIGINTGGSSPIVSSVIRRETEENVPDYYADIALQLGELKSRLKKTVPEVALRRHYLKKAAAMAFIERRTLYKEELQEILKEDTGNKT